MGTLSIMTTLATWILKVGEWDHTALRGDPSSSSQGVHRSCTREDVTKLKVMHAELSLAKAREFSEKVWCCSCVTTSKQSLLSPPPPPPPPPPPGLEGEEDRDNHNNH